MSEQLHPGSHPNADSLNAFMEGVLPEHERSECLAHLAECARCREIVFLAQEPQPASAVSNPVPRWRRWFAPIPILSGAAAASALVILVSLYSHRASEPPAPPVVAEVRPPKYVPAPPPASIPEKAQVAASPRPTASPAVPPSATRPSPPAENPPDTALASVEFPPAPGPMAGMDSALSHASPPPPPKAAPAVAKPVPPGRDALALEGRASESSVLLSDGSLRLSVQHNRGSVEGFSEIAGSVTDPAGAVIPGATVTLRQLDGGSSRDVTTDANGQFKLTAVPAGRYELQIAAPGFRTSSGRFELQAQDLALVASALPVGQSAESIVVSAESSMIQTETTSPLPLPSRLPVANTVARGKLMLSADSSGTLFLSRDKGKHWKTVKPLWQAKAVQLESLPVAVSAPGSPVFRLTTDSGSVWLSRDGGHWYPAPPQP